MVYAQHPVGTFSVYSEDFPAYSEALKSSNSINDICMAVKDKQLDIAKEQLEFLKEIHGGAGNKVHSQLGLNDFYL